jgi:alginate O-acetyltransferase complex protein AlgI
MVFSSAVFLMLFLPLFLLGYYLTPARYQSHYIVFGSYVFYGWWRVDFLALCAGVTLFSYLISIGMVRFPERAKKLLILGIVGNLSTLGYFKYFNFGVDSMNALLGYAGQSGFTAMHVILPIGISFHIFQAVSYLIDIYRKDVKPAEKMMDFFAFSSLFPQLIAGPVIRYKDLEAQFKNRVHSWDKFSEGVIRFAMGFSKKVFIADTLAPIADASFALENPSMLDSWLGILAYTAQLYFDFSGYSDMAIGIGLMMGFRFVENFNHPYISRSITEFWRRWHISLSSWLRDYLYIPLGGNRKGPVRTYINLVLTMVLGGFWHGANWTFVIWGAWHGGIMAIERALGAKSGSPYPKLIALPLTLFLVLLGWVMFRAHNVSAAIGMYKGMFGFNDFKLSGEIAWSITNFQIATLMLACGIFFWPMFSKNLDKALPVINGETVTWAHGLSLFRQIAICGLFAMGVCKLIAQSFSPFLYFQF